MWYNAALNKALATLGLPVYSTWVSLPRNQEPYIGKGIQALSLPKSHPHRFGLEQFESLWADYTAIEGETVVCFASELIGLYPDAKVILTTRGDSEDEVENWFQSLMDTMWYNRKHPMQRLLAHIHPTYRKMQPLSSSYYQHMFWDDFETHGKRRYREHNAMVRRLVPEERLLVYDLRDGWEPLCHFLGRDVPHEDFPHVNRRAEHRALFASGRRTVYWDIARKTLPVLALLLALVFQKVRIYIWARAWLAIVAARVRQHSRS